MGVLTRMIQGAARTPKWGMVILGTVIVVPLAWLFLQDRHYNFFREKRLSQNGQSEDPSSPETVFTEYYATPIFIAAYIVSLSLVGIGALYGVFAKVPALDNELDSIRIFNNLKNILEKLLIGSSLSAIGAVLAVTVGPYFTGGISVGLGVALLPFLAQGALAGILITGLYLLAQKGYAEYRAEIRATRLANMERQERESIESALSAPAMHLFTAAGKAEFKLKWMVDQNKTATLQAGRALTPGQIIYGEPEAFEADFEAAYATATQASPFFKMYQNLSAVPKEKQGFENALSAIENNVTAVQESLLLTCDNDAAHIAIKVAKTAQLVATLVTWETLTVMRKRLGEKSDLIQERLHAALKKANFKELIQHNLAKIVQENHHQFSETQLNSLQDIVCVLQDITKDMFSETLNTTSVYLHQEALENIPELLEARAEACVMKAQEISQQLPLKPIRTAPGVMRFGDGMGQYVIDSFPVKELTDEQGNVIGLVSIMEGVELVEQSEVGELQESLAKRAKVQGISAA